MYNIVRTEDYNTYKIRHFLVDSLSDLSNIVSDFQNELYPGWSATIAAPNSQTTSYILKNDLTTWIESQITTVIV